MPLEKRAIRCATWPSHYIAVYRPRDVSAVALTTGLREPSLRRPGLHSVAAPLDGHGAVVTLTARARLLSLSKWSVVWAVTSDPSGWFSG